MGKESSLISLVEQHNNNHRRTLKSINNKAVVHWKKTIISSEVSSTEESSTNSHTSSHDNKNNTGKDIGQQQEAKNELNDIDNTPTTTNRTTDKKSIRNKPRIRISQKKIVASKNRITPTATPSIITSTSTNTSSNPQEEQEEPSQSHTSNAVHGRGGGGGGNRRRERTGEGRRGDDNDHRAAATIAHQIMMMNETDEEEMREIIMDRLWVDDVNEVEIAIGQLYNLVRDDDSISRIAAAEYNNYDEYQREKEVDRNNCLMALRAGAPLALYRLLVKRFPVHEGIQRWGISFLAEMSCTFAENQQNGLLNEMIDSGGIIEICLQAMSNFRTNNKEAQRSRVLSKVCTLLGNLMNSPALVMKVIAIDDHYHHPQQQQQQQSQYDDLYSYSLVLMALKNALAKYPDDSRLQRSGCYAISRILQFTTGHTSSTTQSPSLWSSSTTTELDTIRLAVVEAKCIQLIVHSMNKHRSYSEIQYHCCRALYYLVAKCSENNNKSYEYYRKLILDSNGLIAASAALSLYQRRSGGGNSSSGHYAGNDENYDEDDDVVYEATRVIHALCPKM